jgi:hypothetical protein
MERGIEIFLQQLWGERSTLSGVERGRYIGIKEMGGNRAPGQDIFRSKLHEGVLRVF